MNQSYNLIQISDCHIDDQVESMGVDTHTNLTSVIKTISKQSCDTLLITGDLTHNGTLNSYQLLQRILTPIKSRIVVLGGNHDQIENLNRVFSEQLITKFSLGNYAVLWQIEHAKTLDLEFLYMGFWIAECKKMSYKTQYHPLQGFIDNQWKTIA